MISVAINGFGRIGRNFLRTIISDPHALRRLHVKVINIGPSSIANVAHMFKYDTVMGIFNGTVSVEGNQLIIDNHRITLLAYKTPAECNWKQYGIDWVVDASGRYTHKEKAQEHIQAGARKVLITAPAKGDDVTIVPGVNRQAYNPNDDAIVSLGSCTTNALLPTLKVLQDTFGIEQAYMTTTHAYTNTQVLLDVEGEDLRRSRAAALNIIPTSTGASDMIGKIIPALEGRVRASAIRVPVAIVSLIDLTFIANKPITVPQINDAFKKAAQSDLKGIMVFTDEPLVSSDFAGSPASVTIDGLLTDAHNNMGKVFGWYDNEWGYSERLKDFLLSV